MCDSVGDVQSTIAEGPKCVTQYATGPSTRQTMGVTGILFFLFFFGTTTLVADLVDDKIISASGLAPPVLASIMPRLCRNSMNDSGVGQPGRVYKVNKVDCYHSA